MESTRHEASLPTLEALRQFVLERLCAQDALDPHQVQLLEQPLRRQGELVGLLLEVRGPRQLHTQAIWACRERCLLFYNSAGERTAVVRLTAWPSSTPQAA